MERPLILLAGATGQLGRLTARHLLRHGARVRALVRPGSAAKLADLAARGLEVVEIALDGSAPLVPVMEGAQTLVSTLQGGPEVIVDLQSRLLEAGVSAGVRRFIPSDFAIDFTRLPPGSNRNFDRRAAFHASAEATLRRSGAALELTSIFQGAFAEMLASGWMLLNFKKRQVQYFGAPDTKMDITTWEDTAAFTAAVALDPNPTPRHLRIAGARLSPRELAAISTQASGRAYGLKHVMSPGMLKAVIMVLKWVKPGKPEDLLPLWVGMQYAWCMAQGASGPLDNDRYPELIWQGIEPIIAGL